LARLFKFKRKCRLTASPVPLYFTRAKPKKYSIDDICNAIEEIKNNFYTFYKFHGGQQKGPPCNVIIFSNDLPPYNNSSGDGRDGSFKNGKGKNSSRDISVKKNSKKISQI
jgi:hypothetical protein